MLSPSSHLDSLDCILKTYYLLQLVYVSLCGFPFTKSFWCDTKKSKEEDVENDLENHGENKVGNSNEIESEEEKEVDPENFEEIPEHLQRKEEENQCIKIRKLKKKFDKGFYAINNLNAEMFEDEIFALLGHNGAGKTTTINVLSGMMAATQWKSYPFMDMILKLR